MGLQRTPPQRAGQSSTTVPEGPGETSLPSPSQAFQPRHPRVMRSPLSGSTSTRPEPPMYPAPEQAVEASTSTTPRTEPRAWPVEPLAAEIEGDRLEPTAEVEPTTLTVEEAYTTPIPNAKRRKSRHPTADRDLETQTQTQTQTHAPTSIGEATRETSQIEKNAMYGKRYEVMMDTLELAVKASSEKWTLEQFTQCFPKFAAENRDLFEKVYETYRTKFRDILWQQSAARIEADRFGPALRKIEDAVADAKANTTDEPRSDAWRADLNAKIIGAAANLPVYDDAYGRLRTEYLELHSDCTKRYASIAEKEALLNDLESTVSDGVVDLDKTIKLLEGFPDDKVVSWMEAVLPSLPASKS